MKRNGHGAGRGIFARAARLLGREPCPGTMHWDAEIKRFVCDQCPRVHWVNSPNHMRDTRNA